MPLLVTHVAILKNTFISTYWGDFEYGYLGSQWSQGAQNCSSWANYTKRLNYSTPGGILCLWQCLLHKTMLILCLQNNYNKWSHIWFSWVSAHRSVHGCWIFSYIFLYNCRLCVMLVCAAVCFGSNIDIPGSLLIVTIVLIPHSIWHKNSTFYNVIQTQISE